MQTYRRCAFTTIKQQIQSLRQQHSSPIYNLTPRIQSLCDRNLLHLHHHPLSILKKKIISHLGPTFHVTITLRQVHDSLNPIVTKYKNFDVLNFEEDHVSRKPSDTFYITPQYLLRTHTSAHQTQNLAKGHQQFVVFGDVYRRDQIDKFHYPVFHQMEAVRMLGPKATVSDQDVVDDIKMRMEKLAQYLFGKCPMRWVEAYFPFTTNSWELQIFFDGKWVQMLGSGVIHDSVLKAAGRQNERGWAAGLGLQRYAMRLFNIPDVRLFWSEDSRFIDQFRGGQICQFKEFSKYPKCLKDISMWIDENYNANDLYGIIREIGGDLIESVDEIDTYHDKKSNRVSKTYQICFRSLERTLTNDEIVKYQFGIRDTIKDALPNVQLR